MNLIEDLTDNDLNNISEFELIKDYPDYQRLVSENRFILIKKFESLLKAESERTGEKGF